MHVLQPNLSLGGHPHMRNHGPGLDRVVADEVGYGAQGRGQRVAEISEAFPLKEGHAPAVNVVPCTPAALAKASKREAKVCRRVRLVKKKCVHVCRGNRCGTGRTSTLLVRCVSQIGASKLTFFMV